MSTFSGISYQLADQASIGGLTFERAVAIAPVEGMAPLKSDDFRIFLPSFRQSREVHRPKAPPKRRFRGFLVEERGEEARVILEDGGKHYDYFLPVRQLHSAGITEENQPFEMDEYEEKIDDDGYLTGYIFRPLAKASDALIDTFDLDEERKRKRSLIFEKFKDDAH